MIEVSLDRTQQTCYHEEIRPLGCTLPAKHNHGKATSYHQQSTSPAQTTNFATVQQAWIKETSFLHYTLVARHGRTSLELSKIRDCNLLELYHWYCMLFYAVLLSFGKRRFLLQYIFKYIWYQQPCKIKHLHFELGKIRDHNFELCNIKDPNLGLYRIKDPNIVLCKIKDRNRELCKIKDPKLELCQIAREVH